MEIGLETLQTGSSATLLSTESRNIQIIDAYPALLRSTCESVSD